MREIVHWLYSIRTRLDWVLVGIVAALSGAGVLTMYAGDSGGTFFYQQIQWLLISGTVFCLIAGSDVRFLRRTPVVVLLYALLVILLLGLFAFGQVLMGAQSWFVIGGLSFQPATLAKLVLVIVLAKYFSRRHVEIARVRHVLISGGYAFALFALIFFQPDFGSAIIIALIWLGMVLVSGIPMRHLTVVALTGLVAFAGLWMYGFADYQKERITAFLHPYANLQTGGYNAYQSMVAVGSGQWWGKGIGYGTQSSLKFLPEDETDFIFAAFAEEWGFVGVLAFMSLYGALLWRIVATAMCGATNFEVLYGAGVAVYFFSQFAIHVGMNIGLLPVTGVTLPLVSYGGSHLLVEFAALGILMAQRGYMRPAPREDMEQEVEGV